MKASRSCSPLAQLSKVPLHANDIGLLTYARASGSSSWLLARLPPSRPASRRRHRGSIPTIPSAASLNRGTPRRRRRTTCREMYELVYNLFVVSRYEPSGLRAKNVNTIDEVPDSSWFTNRIGVRPITNEELLRGANAGAAAGSVEVGPDPREIFRRTPRIHGERRQGRHLVRPVRSAVFRRRRDGRRRDRIEDLLGARLQPGRDVPDDLRSEERVNRSAGHRAAPERQADAIHQRRHERHPRARRAQRRMARIASLPGACSQERFSAATSTRARVLTIRTISSRTRIVGNCGRCASSAPGRT